ncbi:MAG TPA: type I-B CRISPR-associated protein Cas7/Csh2 [Candidatus Acidoferrum sp.]|nr:type I-B CRISPR-associated protein Cas7/Csh2 [Candidatus Acidoferrum sp.]
MSSKKKKSEIYPNRSEILFLYDIFRCNPNGDPFENRPRQDPTTERIDVTDVRLKRTIRDYILRYKHEKGDEFEIFVRTKGDAATAERRYEELFGKLPDAKATEEAQRRLLERCVDARLFGAMLPITRRKKAGEEHEESGAGIHITGAVQFNTGQSLHAVEINEISGTGGFASKEGAQQRTFRREFIVPYALIGFYGVINENLSKETGLTSNDVDLLMESMWQGTQALHSRSKAFHHPRLLIRIDYKDQRQSGFFLDKLQLNIEKGKNEKTIHSPNDYSLEFNDWLSCLQKNSDFITNIYRNIDPGIELTKNGTAVDMEKELNALTKGKA